MVDPRPEAPVGGQDVVSKIEAVPVGNADRPNSPPKIVKVAVAESAG